MDMRKTTTLRLAVPLVSLLVMFYGLSEACAPDAVFVSCHSYFRDVPFTIWSISLSIFLVSILTIFFRTEIFLSWLVFGAVYVPLSVVLIFLAPLQTHDLIAPFDKKTTALWLLCFFLLLSLLIIALKSWKLRGRKNKTK